jgi:hypothetical protein
VILRIWHGWTTSDDADAYQRLLDEEIVPGIIARNISGLQGVDVLRRLEAESQEVEFVTIMRFDDWPAVEAFAGPGGTLSVVPDTARRVLARFDEHSQHYELITSHLS